MYFKPGEKHPIAKLTWEKVDAIRKDYAKGMMTHARLAAKYNISMSTIGKVLRRETWVR